MPLYIPPAASHPGYVSGLYYTVPIGGNTSTLLLTENRLYFWPFFQGDARPVAFDRIAVDATTGAGDASSQIRWGIYRSVNGRPAGLLVDAGVTTISTGTGTLTVTIAQTLPPGWYYLAIISNRNGGAGAVVTLRSNANEARVYENYLKGLPAAVSEVQNSHLVFNDETVSSWGTYTLPATATSGLGAAGTLSPIIFLRAT